MRLTVAPRPEDSRKAAQPSREAPEVSREAAQECSQRRKPWVTAGDELAPKGRKIGCDGLHSFLLTILLLMASPTAVAAEPVQIKIRDLASVEGVRENPLIGYGMIVGLNGTGDKQQTVFAIQTLA